mmetsp:Transcript_5327/g.13276  ORF Transcript_5327/g.13276 Transcript_5327/m.13276 type:complete len:236 (+) Transcript_5327:538-1245(+)
MLGDRGSLVGGVSAAVLFALSGSFLLAHQSEGGAGKRGEMASEVVERWPCKRRASTMAGSRRGSTNQTNAVYRRCRSLCDRIAPAWQEPQRIEAIALAPQRRCAVGTDDGGGRARACSQQACVVRGVRWNSDPAAKQCSWSWGPPGAGPPHRLRWRAWGPPLLRVWITCCGELRAPQGFAQSGARGCGQPVELRLRLVNVFRVPQLWGRLFGVPALRCGGDFPREAAQRPSRRAG